MPDEEPTPARQLRNLPIDARGYRVPAEAPWTEDGTPVIQAADPVAKFLLAAYRACAVCGYPLRRDELAWRIFDDAGRRLTHHQVSQGSGVDEEQAPGHLSCMLYSALVCPYWRTGGARLGKESTVAPGAARGAEPAVMGFCDVGLLVDPAGDMIGLTGPKPVFAYIEYEEEIAFTDPLTDLPERYKVERAAAGGRYIGQKQRHYAPGNGGIRRKLREAQKAHEVLMNTPEQSTVNYMGVPRFLFSCGWMPA